MSGMDTQMSLMVMLGAAQKAGNKQLVEEIIFKMKAAGFSVETCNKKS